MPNFEWALASAFNRLFQSENIAAIAYRLKQSRYTSQSMDILVDSRDPLYYLAVECKSLDATKAKAIYFKQHFTSTGGVHQILRETEFLRRSGRIGILAVELRFGAGRPLSARLIPWTDVLSSFISGSVGISIQEMEPYTSLYRNKGEYHISRNDIAALHGYSYEPIDDQVIDPDHRYCDMDQ